MILVVDDDCGIRSLLTDTLISEGYLALGASSAVEAFRILQYQEAQAVICDIQMPGKVDGVTLATWIMEQFPTTPLILTSGAASLRKMATLFPTTPFFPKPFRLSALFETLEFMVKHGAPAGDEHGRSGEASTNVIGIAATRLASAAVR